MEDIKKESILYTEEEISKRVKELGEEISREYKGKDLLVISLLKGSFIFTSDLVRSMDIPVEIDFMTTASYGDSEISSGKVEIVHDLRSSVEGRHVLITDDIIDSGRTLKIVKDMLEERNPASIRVCTLLDKPERRTEAIDADYVGFTIDDLFIVGYGLNYGSYYRNIPFIFTFDK